MGTFSDGLQKEIEVWTKQFDVNPCWSTGKKLSDAILVFIILFNRKRSGEVSKMLVQNYLDTKECGKNYDEDETFWSLSEFEQDIARNHLLVKLIRKKDQHVPLLLTSFLIRSVDMLVKQENRVKMGIPVVHKFLFSVR